MAKVWQKKWFRVMCWQVFNALIGAIIAYASEMDAESTMGFLAFFLPLLNFTTKRVNTNIFGDLGVEK